MTSAELLKGGIKVIFADGHAGVVPFSEIPGVDVRENLTEVELPNLYGVVLNTTSGETVELPWDFVRHFCGPSYRPRVETVGLADRLTIGTRIRRLRKSAGLTQRALALAGGVGRVTLVRIENGVQSPRYETLGSLADALGRPIAELLAVGETVFTTPGEMSMDKAGFKPIQIVGEDLSDTVLRERS